MENMSAFRIIRTYKFSSQFQIYSYKNEGKRASYILPAKFWPSSFLSFFNSSILVLSYLVPRFRGI
jgi:hypothetical protein